MLCGQQNPLNLMIAYLPKHRTTKGLITNRVTTKVATIIPAHHLFFSYSVSKFMSVILMMERVTPQLPMITTISKMQKMQKQVIYFCQDSFSLSLYLSFQSQFIWVFSLISFSRVCFQSSQQFLMRRGRPRMKEIMQLRMEAMTTMAVARRIYQNPSQNIVEMSMHPKLKTVQTMIILDLREKRVGCERCHMEKSQQLVQGFWENVGQSRLDVVSGRIAISRKKRKVERIMVQVGAE